MKNIVINYTDRRQVIGRSLRIEKDLVRRKLSQMLASNERQIWLISNNVLNLVQTYFNKSWKQVAINKDIFWFLLVFLATRGCVPAASVSLNGVVFWMLSLYPQRVKKCKGNGLLSLVGNCNRTWLSMNFITNLLIARYDQTSSKHVDPAYKVERFRAQSTWPHSLRRERR